MIVGLYFIVVMTLLHGSDGDSGFTTTHGSTFYKAAGLIMGKNRFKLFVDNKIMVSE